MPAPERPRRKTLIFHIGDHKTGSTSVQLAFAKGQVALDGHSVFYPARLASNTLGAQCRAYGNAETPEARQKAARPFQKLAAQIQASKADFALVSAEALETVPAALFHEIAGTFFAGAADEIRIIGYVRPHAARILSSFAERIKVGTPRALRSDLDSFATRRKEVGEFIYLPRFAAWREHFADRFILRPMIRSQLYQGDVVSDFIHHAFGGLGFTISGESQANESLCLEDLMRLKVLQKALLHQSKDLRLKVGWEFSRLAGHLPPAPARTRLQLYRALAKTLRDSYLEDARNMDRMFFSGEPLMENELHTAVKKAIAKPQSTAPADHLSPSELHGLTLMAGMISGLLDAGEVNWPAFLHGKRVRDAEAALQPASAAE
ncbi:hypothetical protein J4729_07735 [Leisingera sp. HS039]|uniref:hypothetical protein n=1 Tax=Leisingera sp. HS039 TaxID=2818496 RepID=UPI001B3A6F06|nr:hypothetical protein [Leisingera sp. HS039]MBQ4824441.1 hypothetical protein [Leisingera sp. HS039]